MKMKRLLVLVLMMLLLVSCGESGEYAGSHSSGSQTAGETADVDGNGGESADGGDESAGGSEAANGGEESAAGGNEAAIGGTGSAAGGSGTTNGGGESAADGEASDHSGEPVDIVVEPDHEIPVDFDETFLEELTSEYWSPTLVVGDAKATQGEEVTLLAVVVQNPGILGMSASLSYDESAMTLVSVKNGEAFSGILTLTTSATLKNGCCFLWDGLDLTPDQVKDGEVLQLVFRIHDDAKGGKYPIKLILEEGGTVDRDLKQLDIGVDCGYVTID